MRRLTFPYRVDRRLTSSLCRFGCVEYADWSDSVTFLDIHVPERSGRKGRRVCFMAEQSSVTTQAFYFHRNGPLSRSRYGHCCRNRCSGRVRLPNSDHPESPKSPDATSLKDLNQFFGGTGNFQERLAETAGISQSSPGSPVDEQGGRFADPRGSRYVFIKAHAITGPSPHGRPIHKH